MICKNCGETIEDHAKFCINCGIKQEEQDVADVPQFEDMLQSEMGETSPKYPDYTDDVKNPKPVLLIVAAIVVAIVAGLTAFSVVCINLLKPDFYDEMQFVSIEEFASSHVNYLQQKNGEPAIVYTFDNATLANLLFPTIKEGEDADLSFQSIRYDLDNEVLLCNATFRGIDVMVNYNTSIKFEESENDVKMIFRIKDPTFGSKQLESDLFAKLIPVSISSKTVVLTDIAKHATLLGTREQESAIDLVLTPDKQYLSSILRDSKMEVDENFYLISETSEEDLTRLIEGVSYDESYLKDLLAFYTPEGITYLKGQAPYLDSILTKDFLTSIETDKEILNQAYIEKMEAIRRQEEELKAQIKNQNAADRLRAVKDMVNSLSTYMRTNDVVEANGRVYLGFDTNNIVKISDLGDQNISQYYDIRTLNIVFDAEIGSSGICYPKDVDEGESDFGILFINGMTKDISSDEFELLYNKPKPLKTALTYPFAGQDDWDGIMQAVNFNESGSVWVRYVCSDGQYAYVVVSPQQMFYTAHCMFLKKEPSGAWSIVEAAGSKGDFKRIAQNAEFTDLNINMFPSPAPAEFEFVEIGVDDVLQGLGLPAGFDYEGFLPAPITYYSKLGSYLYVYLKSDVESYMYVYEYQTQNLVQIFSYADLQKFAAERSDFPIYIGLQQQN